MAQRQKRSVSLPPDLADAIDRAAQVGGISFSGWLAETAAHRLRLDAGQHAIAEWEQEHGPLTETELADGLARARALLDRAAPDRTAPSGGIRRTGPCPGPDRGDLTIG